MRIIEIQSQNLIQLADDVVEAPAVQLVDIQIQS